MTGSESPYPERRFLKAQDSPNVFKMVLYGVQVRSIFFVYSRYPLQLFDHAKDKK